MRDARAIPRIKFLAALSLSVPRTAEIGGSRRERLMRCEALVEGHAIPAGVRGNSAVGFAPCHGNHDVAV